MSVNALRQTSARATGGRDSRSTGLDGANPEILCAAGYKA
jgi:hypothetical protein